jgi:hypothetical protein
MPDLATVRDRAQRHQDELDRNTRFYTVGDLAARWRCAKGTVRSISKLALPYTNLGHGLKRELRRYHPDDVAAYEATRLEKAS